MSRNPTIWLALAGVLPGWWAVTVAEPMFPASALRPVDQAVADLDPLATSLRRVEVGLGRDGQQASLFEVAPPPGHVHHVPVYYRIGPGFVTRVNRMDYLVRRGRRELAMNEAPFMDGEFIELIPANTVFELTPLDQLARQRAQAGPSGGPGPGLDDGRAGVNHAGDGVRWLGGPHPDPLAGPPDPAAWTMPGPYAADPVFAPVGAPLDYRLTDGPIDGRIDGRVHGLLPAARPRPWWRPGRAGPADRPIQ